MMLRCLNPTAVKYLIASLNYSLLGRLELTYNQLGVPEDRILDHLVSSELDDQKLVKGVLMALDPGIGVRPEIAIEVLQKGQSVVKAFSGLLDLVVPKVGAAEIHHHNNVVN